MTLSSVCRFRQRNVQSREFMSVAESNSAVVVVCQRVTHIERQDCPVAWLANGSKIRLPRLLGGHIAAGDEITFAAPDGNTTAAEILVHGNSPLRAQAATYLTPIGYVTQPKADKRNEHFVAAAVPGGHFGISSVMLPCEALREYFYGLPRAEEHGGHTSLYDRLNIPARASLAELRVGCKLRALELEASGTRADQVALERAFNILGHPEIRAVYDSLLANRDLPATFLYGGFGSLLVAGERGREGLSFFARRSLAFSPEQQRRRFRVSLRSCEFYEGFAVCRDVRRRLELWLDPAVLHATWSPEWNQWKHRVAGKLEVDASFVRCDKYRKRRGAWELIRWNTALPSRLKITLPKDFAEQIEAAQSAHHRFGQCSEALAQIRLRLEYRALAKAELEKLCAPLRLPGDFDLAQISWRPDYDRFFYQQLASRARRMYLFRDEYICDLEKAVVIETPQLGHATYIFAKPRNMENFLAAYINSSKEDIRQNRDNVAERLRFQTRVVHGTNPTVWLKEVRQWIGEGPELVAATAD
jgi:hypothetical protein